MVVVAAQAGKIVLVLPIELVEMAAAHQWAQDQGLHLRRLPAQRPIQRPIQPHQPHPRPTGNPPRTRRHRRRRTNASQGQIRSPRRIRRLSLHRPWTRIRMILTREGGRRIFAHTTLAGKRSLRRPGNSEWSVKHVAHRRATTMATRLPRGGSGPAVVGLLEILGEHAKGRTVQIHLWAVRAARLELARSSPTTIGGDASARSLIYRAVRMVPSPRRTIRAFAAATTPTRKTRAAPPGLKAARPAP